MRKLLLIFLLVGLAPLADDEPRQTEITERVDVRLVLIDVTVVDKRRDIVTGLTRDDFILRLDHEIVPIVSLDMSCPEAPVSEPPAVNPGDVDTAWEAPDRARKIVFAVDYRHLEQTQRPEVLDQIRAAIQRLHRSNEQLMIVALTDFLRVELPPTTDGEAAIAALDRMEHDISLWLPPFDHLHDGPTFEALLNLTELLGDLGDDKLVVLFSNWPSSGFNNDDWFDKLTRRATRQRVSFYTVWTRGLQPWGTSRNLARLAVETGGRFTERTNDFTLAYARAQRDSSCRYTIGFHDSTRDPDRTRFLDLRVGRRGVRVHHPDRYAPADPENTRDTLSWAALAWPSLYASESVRVELLPVRPISRRRWETVFALEGSGPSTDPVRVRARLRRGNTRWTRTDESRMVPFSASQSIHLRHGPYASSITLDYPAEDRPRSAMSSVDLPHLDDDHGWWFSDPLVLRSLGPVAADAETLEGTALEGDPLTGRVPVLERAETDEVLSLLHTVCRYGATPETATVSTNVRLDSGSRRVFETDRTFEFVPGNGLRCEELDEALPSLPAGAYTATVRLRPTGGEESVRRHGFEIREPQR